MSLGLAADPRARFWQLWAELCGPECQQSNGARHHVMSALAAQVTRLHLTMFSLEYECLLSDFERKFRMATGDPECRRD